MIGILRRIRLYLLSEYRFSKYLLCALGEIVLVVIGILIALQINNWNEERISTQKEVVILEEIHRDLVPDLENQINPSIEYYAAASEAFDYLRSDFYESSVAPPVEEKFSWDITGDWKLTLSSGSSRDLGSACPCI